MALTKEEISLLLELDRGTPPVPVDLAEKFLTSGWVDESLDLTAEGVELIEKIKERLRLLEDGILAAKKKPDPAAILADEKSPTVWFTGTISSKPAFSNKEVVVIGKPDKKMVSERGTTEFRKRLPVAFGQATRQDDYQEVTPLWFQTDGTLSGLSLYWMAEKDGRKMAAMQAKYFDYFSARFKSGIWYHSRAGKNFCISVPNQGVTDRNIVALVMEFFTPEGWKVPGRGRG
jgi:hypothetical protein